MKFRECIVAFTAVVMVVGTIGSVPTAAAETKRHLGSYRDWEAFVYGTGAKRTCHMISVPKSWKASKKKVNRGKIYAMVSHRPEYGITGEVNMVMGYPVRQGSDAIVRIDGRKRLEFFTEGDSAWAYDPKDDAAAILAMKRGSGLTVAATSQRGTNTTDKYSLSGFTAAYNAITKDCR